MEILCILFGLLSADVSRGILSDECIKIGAEFLTFKVIYVNFEGFNEWKDEKLN